MRRYVAERQQYEVTAEKHRREFGDVGFDKIKQPDIPEILFLYFELQRWPGSLLWDGGLQDQPAWVWDLMDLAGIVYQDAIRPRPKVEGT